jgi:squalene synthase HpnC
MTQPAVAIPHTPPADGSPPTVAAAFAPVNSLAEAEQYTHALAHSHYENFSVVSTLLPRHLQQDFCNIYAFCRTADDLGDETPDTDTALAMLDRFKEQTRRCYAGRAETAVFVALSGTIRRHDIPIEPFVDLIDAFEQDQRVRRYDTFAELLEYCRRSANPVGRLVLYLCGYRDERRRHLSDQTCTALQLANFWQDVRRDFLDLDRIYLPRESMRKFGVTEEDLGRQIREFRCADAARDLIRFEVDRTRALFDEGDKLLPLLDGGVRPQIRLFGRGGRAILAAIGRRNYDTLTRRPSLSRWQKGRLILASLPGVLLSKMLPARRRGAE